MATQSPKPPINKGLEGLVVADTQLSEVDGEHGRLIYHGYEIADLAQNATFEDVAYLLWMGQLPTASELQDLNKRMAANRLLPDGVLDILKSLPTSTVPMDVLRTGASALGAVKKIDGKATLEDAIALTAAFPTIVAAFQRMREGKAPIAPRADLSHAANYLYMLTGSAPSEQKTRALDTYLVLTADHGLNASTFTARVIASTEADMCSSVVGAIGALKGPLHGGAPQLVLDMLKAIGTAENAETWIRNALNRHEKLMGFGHRVYKTEDPRARVLRKLADQLTEVEFFKLASTVEDTALRLLHELKPERRIYTNVEFWSAAVMHAVGLPDDLFTPTFGCSRVAGWTAHVLEQQSDNRLIRPASEYVGPWNLKVAPIGQRT